MSGMGSHQSARSATDEWLTPPDIIAKLGGAASFDLDPCTPFVQPYPTARRRFTKLENGLMQPWAGRVWLNPPYSTVDVEKWLGRLVDHGQGTALIFARTETDNFFRLVWESASAVLFLRGRIYFHLPCGKRAKHNSGAPSVLCAYGEEDAAILEKSRIAGKFLRLRDAAA